MGDVQLTRKVCDEETHGGRIMAYEQRDNSGIMFKNSRKTKPTHPDRQGTAMVGGVMYQVSGWIKEGAKGPFMTLSFQLKESAGKEQFSKTPDDDGPGF